MAAALHGRGEKRRERQGRGGKESRPRLTSKCVQEEEHTGASLVCLFRSHYFPSLLLLIFHASPSPLSPFLLPPLLPPSVCSPPPSI